MTQLIIPVRDNDGHIHNPKELVMVRNIVKRGDFDNRPLVNVTFQDGSRGAVFLDEVTGAN